jgi:hypothetical protein
VPVDSVTSTEPPPRSDRLPRIVVETPEADEGTVVELYVSAGRRQGAKPSDYERYLKEAGIGAESIAYVRVRHRNAFVGVERGVEDLALSALDGANIAGTRVKAELSRGRPASSENDAAEPHADE